MIATPDLTTKRHYLVPDVLEQEVVQIAVAGAGGTGSHFLIGLATIAKAYQEITGKSLSVTVFDGDRVSAANLYRQPYFEADVGVSKASTLVNRINLTYGLFWKAMPVMLTQSSQLPRGTDFLITCVDSIAAREKFASHFLSHTTYWLDFGNSSHSGQWVMGCDFPAHKLPYPHKICPELVIPNPAENDQPSCSLAEALRKQSLFINRGLVQGALACLWQLLHTGYCEFHGQFCNIGTGNTSALRIPN